MNKFFSDNKQSWQSAMQIKKKYIKIPLNIFNLNLTSVPLTCNENI